MVTENAGLAWRISGRFLRPRHSVRSRRKHPMEIARRLFIAGLFTAFGAAHAAPVNPLVEAAAFALDELHIIGVDTDGDQHLRWATWSEAGKQGAVLNLTLLARVKPKRKTRFTIKDAYEPALRRIDGWRHGVHPVVAFTYRQGAAAQQLEIYGLNDMRQAVLLDQRLGEQIEWRVGRDGEMLLSVFAKPEGRLVPSCYGWQEKPAKLSVVACD